MVGELRVSILDTVAVAVSATPAKFSPIPSIGLGTFIRFDSADGNHQIDVVEDYRSGEYDLLKDFYLALRHQIRRLAGERNLAANNLLVFSDQIDDETKQRRFRAIAKGYRAVEKQLKPQLGGVVEKQVWSDAGLRVVVDPEVVFILGQQRFITKFYLGKDSLVASRLIASLQLLRETYNRPGYRVAILDCERGKLHRDTRLDERRSAIQLRVTAAKFVGIWRALDQGVEPRAVPGAS
jgi:hypothetical protein